MSLESAQPRLGIPLFHVDAFAVKPFAGNPAGVCLPFEPCDDSWLKSVAREMNLPETAFLRARTDGWDLRWFSPSVEVDLCGHATLASAHVLWESGRLSPEEPAKFFTRSGPLAARRDGEEIEMDFPLTAARQAEAPPGLAEALGASWLSLVRCGPDYLLEFDSEKAVRALKPDFPSLAKIPSRGWIATSSSSSSEFDFVSRFFAPALGIPEDPATGSSHCALAPFWKEKTGRSRFTGFQASERGGVVGAEVRGDRVMLRGRAVTVLRGELLV